MKRYRPLLLLASLFILILTLPLLPMLGAWSHYAAAFFFSLVLLAAVIATARRRITGNIVMGLFAAVFSLELIGVWYRNDMLQIIDSILTALFLASVICILLHNMFRKGHITLGSICTALSAYLLLAVLFATLYALVELIEPGAFAFNVSAEGHTPSMRFDSGRSLTPIYYSLVTITTLGYGDIVPVTPMASMLAVVEAVIGQFYLTVLVAWLVGMYISTSINSRKRRRTAKPGHRAH